MKNGFLPCLRGELWKVFHARAFYIALAAGLLIQLYNVVWNIEYVQEIYNSGPRHADGDTRSLFILWLSANGTLAYFLFRWLFPLLALIPYGWSYRSEAQSGYNTRIKRRLFHRQIHRNLCFRRGSHSNPIRREFAIECYDLSCCCSAQLFYGDSGSSERYNVSFVFQSSMAVFDTLAEYLGALGWDHGRAFYVSVPVYEKEHLHFDTSLHSGISLIVCDGFLGNRR